MARLEVRRGNLDDAVAWFRRALALEPRHVPSVRDLGLVLERMGRLTEARNLAVRAIALEPGDH